VVRKNTGPEPGIFTDMNIIIETERLLLREFTEHDATLIYELNIDPDVTRFTHDPVKDLDHAFEILQETILPQYVLYRHGRWTVFTKHSMEFIGWCGLKYRAELNEIDLGYRFKKEAWGKGYATEAAYASIKYGFEKLQLKCITGRAEIKNIGSWKVLEKCGMTYIGVQEVDDYPVKTYEIFNPSVK
jgi:RimJ/RimL family protein N-acetyltransferase